MFRKIVLMALVVLSINLYGQVEKPVDSKITGVTVFLNRAQVTRAAKTKLEAGTTTLIFQGLTSQLDQQSIQVAGKGKFTILGINHQQNFGKEFASAKTQKLRDSIQFSQQQISIEQNMKEILNKEEQMLLSNQKIGGTNQNLTVTELKAMADFYRIRLSDISEERFKQDNKIARLNEQLSRLQMQLREVNDLYARHTSEILVSVSTDAATSAEFELNYVVANAGWVPVYDLRATGTNSPVQLSYKANVFQGTGEEWKNVRLILSTANPSLGGVKPELSPWYVDLLRPVVRTARYRYDGGASREEKAAPVAAEVAADKDYETEDSTTIADYITTIQTALNTEFVISLPYSVSSSNKPTLVDIANHSLKAEYLYSVSPKLDKDAFLLAMVTGWEEFSLLPGEANVFFEGTFIAKSFIDPQSIKDTLSVSLGRDKRIVVQREKIKDLSSRKTMGANQKDSYGYTISVRNAKSESIKIVIEDQVPVSQNSQVEVTLLDNGGAQFQKEYGKLKWQLSVGPQETRKFQYSYEVKYPKDKMIARLD
jgi:uncharacterized protein (TIGR02231 family)